MIDILNTTLKNVLETQITAVSVTVGFDVPNDHWRQQVAQAGGNWLNVYLVEVIENRKLRSNELISEWQNGVLSQRLAPIRLDCRYLVSAWTRAGINPTPLVESAIDEAVVLYEAARVLFHNSPLDTAHLYSGPPPPPEFLEQPLPTMVAPPDGFGKLADFWMRMDWAWKPVLELVVTLPVAAVPQPAGHPVTTVFGEVLQSEHPESTEELVVIGGTVRAGAPPVPVPRAWIRIVELDWMVTADEAGRFLFSRIARGDYHVVVGALGYAPQPPRELVVPSLAGSYDLLLT